MSVSKPEVANPLDELIEISREIGRDADLVQGGGGNTSVKSDDGKWLFVKASGAPLADVDETRGWTRLDLEAAREIPADARLARMSVSRREAAVRQRLAEAVIDGPSGARPSVESSLHALLGRVVVHTHPIGLNALLSSVDSRRRALDLLAGVAGEPLYVPYVDPGYSLACEVEHLVAEYSEEHGKLPTVVLLENHGLCVSSRSVRRCLTLTRKITKLGAEWAGLGPINVDAEPDEAAGSGDGKRRKVTVAELRGAMLRGGASPCCVCRDSSDITAKLLRRKDGIDLARKGSVTPDQVHYCGAFPLVLDAARPRTWEASVARYREKAGIDPRVLIVPREGVFYASETLPQLRVVGQVYRAAIVAMLVGRKAGGPRFLERKQARFLENWEVETFRSRLAALAGKPLAGRIALVTGGASGLGKGIALGLVEAGATVFACDVDANGLEEVRATQPDGRYLPLFCDVTSEESVAGAFAAAEATTGGIDHVVNAAGIAPSFDLVDFPLGAWQKTLDINLTGYFLCAREAARLLVRQGAGGGIVNLTSKSGLDASRANSAYNATKAGEIHLMRGWALELGGAGIRVNCVAPGNVFKGSKIWNDEYIRICAKKKGIAPEEVIPHYTSMSPLGEEIEPLDIANAIVWLLSDAARRVTGQTIVVDGGQVMVR